MPMGSIGRNKRSHEIDSRPLSIRAPSVTFDPCEDSLESDWSSMYMTRKKSVPVIAEPTHKYVLTLRGEAGWRDNADCHHGVNQDRDRVGPGSDRCTMEIIQRGTTGSTMYARCSALW